MNTIDTSTSTSTVYGYSILVGFGDGLFSQASFSVAQAVVDPELVSLAVGFITCAQVVGITISLAIANSLFLNGSQDKIQEILPNVSTKVIQEAISGAGSDFVKSLSPDIQARVLDAIVDSMSKSYILVIVAGAVVLVCSMVMKRERLFMEVGHVG